MKKKIAIIFTLLAILILTVTLAGCGSSKSSTSSQSQTYTVRKGDITVDITAAGNLELATVKGLTFDLFYKEGTVSSVNVSVGDTVTKGEVLASLDTAEWNDAIQALEDTLTTAQRNVATKQRALTTAERAVETQTRLIAGKEEAVITAQRQVTAAQLQLQQAQLDIQSANNTLYKISAIQQIQDEIDTLQYDLNFITADQTFSQNYTQNQQAIQLQKVIDTLQDQINSILNGSSTTTTTDVQLQVAQAELNIQVKQLALTNAQVAVGDAQTAVDDASTALANAQQDLTFAQEDVADAQTAVDDATKAVTEAQQNLDDAKAASPDIIAPFDGFVTKVNVAGGDQVLSGAVAVTIADPNKFEANILVSEMDISQVNVGGDATISLDAISGVSLPAKVTQISPTATISSGVVNYAVTVTLQSTAATSANATSDNTSGQAAAPVKTASYTLREGLTATVSLIVQQSKDVIVVPYTAVTTENGQSYVQVITATGTTEKRAIKTGVTNYTYTEVTEGLTAGEKISLAKTTTTTTTTKTTTAQQQQSGISIPGISGGGGPPPGGQ